MKAHPLLRFLQISKYEIFTCCCLFFISLMSIFLGNNLYFFFYAQKSKTLSICVDRGCTYIHLTVWIKIAKLQQKYVIIYIVSMISCLHYISIINITKDIISALKGQNIFLVISQLSVDVGKYQFLFSPIPLFLCNVKTSYEFDL